MGANGSNKLKPDSFAYYCPNHGKVTKSHLKTCPHCRNAGLKKNGGPKRPKGQPALQM